MINSIIVSENSKTRNITSAEFEAMKKTRFVWVDVENPEKEDYDFLKKKFSLHALACDPVFDPQSRPKIFDFDSHTYLVFQEPLKEGKSISFPRLDIFLGKDFIITVHKKSLPSVDTIMESITVNPVIAKKGASFIAYSILDQIVDSYFPLLDELDSVSDDLEDEVFLDPGKATLRKIFSLKRRIMRIKKRISPEREVVISLLSRYESKIVDPSAALYFRDVYDRLIRISDMLDIYRDLLTGILDVYVSVQSNKLNEIMKVLTVIATIMMPLTLITGFYGMNIVFPEVLHLGEQAYFFIASLMFLVLFVMLLYFRKKKWF